MLKKMNKTTKNNMITYAMVIVALCSDPDLDAELECMSSLVTGTAGSNLYLYDSGSFSEPSRWYSGRAEPWTCRIYVCRSIYKCIFLQMHEECDH